MEYFRQCKFVNGNLSTVAYIPEEGAKVGHSMLFKHDKESGRWTVVEVSSNRVLKDEVKNSDIFGSIKERE